MSPAVTALWPPTARSKLAHSCLGIGHTMLKRRTPLAVPAPGSLCWHTHSPAAAHPQVELIHISEERLDQVVAAPVVQQEEAHMRCRGERGDLAGCRGAGNARVGGVPSGRTLWLQAQQACKPESGSFARPKQSHHPQSANSRREGQRVHSRHAVTALCWPTCKLLKRSTTPRCIALECHSCSSTASSAACNTKWYKYWGRSCGGEQPKRPWGSCR